MILLFSNDYFTNIFLILNLSRTIFCEYCVCCIHSLLFSFSYVSGDFSVSFAISHAFFPWILRVWACHLFFDFACRIYFYFEENLRFLFLQRKCLNAICVCVSVDVFRCSCGCVFTEVMLMAYMQHAIAKAISQ